MIFIAFLHARFHILIFNTFVNLEQNANCIFLPWISLVGIETEHCVKYNCSTIKYTKNMLVYKIYLMRFKHIFFNLLKLVHPVTELTQVAPE